MKISCLLVLIFTISCSSPEPFDHQTRRVKLHYENSSGEKGVSTFEYDGNGRVIKSKWELLDGSRYSINYHLYDENNREIEKYREFSDSLITSLKFFYDNNGVKTSEEFFATDGREGTTTFKYNEKGQLKSANCKQYYGWLDGQMNFISNEEGNLFSATLQRPSPPNANIVYEYDEMGDLINEIWDFEGKWKQVFHWEYEPVRTSYTSSNVFIPENSQYYLSKETYTFNNENGGPSEFIYDKNGKLLEKIFTRSDSLQTKTIFNYNPEGILNWSERTYSDNKTGRFSYAYNGLRKLTKREFICSDGTTSSEEYFYDASGNLYKAYWVNFDNWLTGELTFFHNRKGLLDEGVFKGKDNFDANLKFSYNKQGNLSKIRWDFSFGKMQEYNFEWKKFPL